MFKADNKIKNYFNNVKRGFKHDLKNNFMSVALKGFYTVMTPVVALMAWQGFHSGNVDGKVIGVMMGITSVLFGAVALTGIHGLAKSGRDEVLRKKIGGVMGGVEFNPHKADFFGQGVSIVRKYIKNAFTIRPD